MFVIFFIFFCLSHILLYYPYVRARNYKVWIHLCFVSVAGIVVWLNIYFILLRTEHILSTLLCNNWVWLTNQEYCLKIVCSPKLLVF